MQAPRLPGTAVEAKAIQPALEKYAGEEAWLYKQDKALEGVFKSFRGPRVLVLTPTRELALQVTTAVEKYSKFMSRVRTGMAPTEMTCAIPAAKLPEILVLIQQHSGADNAVAKYAADDALRF